MNRPILRAGLTLGALGLGLVGCQGTPKTKTQPTQADKASTPDDPTLWSRTVMSKGETDDAVASAAGAPKGIFTSGRLSGAMSPEGADIEKSLGVK